VPVVELGQRRALGVWPEPEPLAREQPWLEQPAQDVESLCSH
jgi:hypothetical protein